MEKGETFKVLDHGYVKLIDWMGTDESIIEAARMSTGKSFISWEPYEGKPDGDQGLLEFLFENRHTTPFEMCELKIEVQAPIMVYREWHRHRTQSFSEFSARYAQMPNLHYVPNPERIQRQSKSNKQGSAEPFSEAYAGAVIKDLKDEQEAIYQSYDDLIQDGVANEIARINTPVSRYSKMTAKTDLWNWLHFLGLRTAPGAQWEIRQYANVVASIVQALWPRTFAIVDEHMLGATRFSRTEMALLTQVISRVQNLDLVDITANTTVPKKRVEKFLKKIGRPLP